MNFDFAERRLKEAGDEYELKIEEFQKKARLLSENNLRGLQFAAAFKSGVIGAKVYITGIGVVLVAAVLAGLSFATEFIVPIVLGDVGLLS